MAKYDGRVRLSFRDYPLRTLHHQAQAAAEASHCAGDQGKFWEYHDALFANQAKLSAPDLVENARALQLDEKQFDACLKGGKYKAGIDRDLKEGADAGVTGTPAFIVNGVFVNGAVPASTFERLIEQELAAGSVSKRVQSVGGRPVIENRRWVN